MSWRYQLPVSAPVSVTGLVDAFAQSVLGGDAARQRLSLQLSRTLRAPNVYLTQNGTAALVMALRRTVAPGGTVALPAYGCADLTGAAIRAGVRVRLYDIDPVSLSADVDSVSGALRRGVDAIVVAHLFGVPADVRAVATLAEQQGVPAIEDAAQGLGSTLHGQSTGSLADRSVLSFGRGKGVNGGGGGALLERGEGVHAQSSGDLLHLRAAGRGLRSLAVTSVQSLIGHPMLYRVPASLPFLQLGEMVYKDAEDPVGMPIACATMAHRALSTLPARVTAQRAIAARYAAAVPTSHAVQPCDGAEASWLRYPVRVPANVAVPTELGVLRGYPAALPQQRHIGAVLCPGEPDMPGARTLARDLVTLPTHQLMTASDVDRVSHWLTSLRSSSM